MAFTYNINIIKIILVKEGMLVENTNENKGVVVTEEAKARQAQSMKEKWQDPVYRLKVSAGRATKKVEKLTKELEALRSANPVDAEKVQATEKALDAANAKLAEVKAELAKVQG
jgi:hypothetical protein